MIEPNNGHSSQAQTSEALQEFTAEGGTHASPARIFKPKAGKYTGEVLLRTRPKTYRKIVALLADPDWSKIRIAQACRVSNNTVDAVQIREASTIAERKKTLTSVLVDVATLGAEQMERKIGRGSLRDVTVATGVTTDKVLALQGQTPVGVQVAVVMPTEEERAERRALHDRLDAIAARLNASE